jgi:hypothetical protein
MERMMTKYTTIEAMSPTENEAAIRYVQGMGKRS